MNDDDFAKLVAEGIDALPEHVAKHMDNVAITIADKPSLFQRQRARLRPYSLLFGLYEGVPKTARGAYGTALPDKITIFKNDILHVAGPDIDSIRQMVADTVLHEVAHHFGMNEYEVREMERRRRERE